MINNGAEKVHRCGTYGEESVAAGLYIHVPFCASRCSYCNFYSTIGRADFEAYASALISELRLRVQKLAQKPKIDTVYFGGGTPSLMPAGAILRILEAVRELCVLAADTEVTLELNPGTANADKIRGFAQAGVNRLSIGLQSADGSALELLGRKHTAGDFANAANASASAGISNLSADLLIGIPGQNPREKLLDSAAFALSCGARHISAYALKAEPKTPLYRLRRDLPDADGCADDYAALLELLQKRNVLRYEISNFALSGYESRHNLHYWRNEEYIGIGASAHGFFSCKRYQNAGDIDAYYRRLALGRLPQTRAHIVTAVEDEFNFLMLGLRLEKGVSLTEFEAKYGDFWVKYGKKAEELQRLGMLETARNRLFIPSRHFYVQSLILEKLLF